MGEFRTVHDPGLQQERTVLAWDRTALALMVASGLLLRVTGAFSPRAIVVIPALALVIGLTILTVDRRRYLVRWRRMEAGEAMTSNVLVTLMGTTTVVVGGTTLVVVLLIWLR